MFRRLFGLLLIIRGLSPVLIVVVIAVTGALLLNEVQAALQEPVAAIHNELDQVSATIDTIRGEVDVAKQRITQVTDQVTNFVGTVGSNIDGIVAQFRAVLKPINDAVAGVRSALGVVKSGVDGFVSAANSVVQVLNVGCPTLRPCIKLPTIPKLELPNLLPDVEPLAAAVRSAFAPLQQIFADFQPAVESIRQAERGAARRAGYVQAHRRLRPTAHQRRAKRRRAMGHHPRHRGRHPPLFDDQLLRPAPDR